MKTVVCDDCQKVVKLQRDAYAYTFPVLTGNIEFLVSVTLVKGDNVDIHERCLLRAVHFVASKMIGGIEDGEERYHKTLPSLLIRQSAKEDSPDA